MRTRYLALGLGIVAAVSAYGPLARAEYPDPAVYVGLYRGYTFPLADWDLGDAKPEVGGNLPRASGSWGVRVGAQILPQLAAEGEFAYMPLNTDLGGDNTTLSYSANVLYHLTRCNLAPYVMAGGGAYNNVDGPLGEDADGKVHVGAGVRGLLLPWLATRVELRDVFTDGRDGLGNNLEGNFGLEFFIPIRTAPPDRDGDKVPDADDACPDVKGLPELQGCPDADRDGVADAQDRCPDKPGPVQLGGCPDADGDGLIDSQDACPTQAGPEQLQGCPDTDGDGIADAQDRCPQQAGKPEFQGCADSDGDGVEDSADQCPQEAGLQALQGCPDRDGDNVADKADKCPDTPGLVENEGCLPVAVQRFTGAIEGINFPNNSARILPTSYKVLDAAVDVLKRFPSLRMRIEGHTDNRGNSEANMKLSNDRAEAVRQYLISKGIDAGRLETQGFGETKPVKPNTTAAGRAANRRIEFVPIRQRPRVQRD